MEKNHRLNHIDSQMASSRQAPGRHSRDDSHQNKTSFAEAIRNEMSKLSSRISQGSRNRLSNVDVDCSHSIVPNQLRVNGSASPSLHSNCSQMAMKKRLNSQHWDAVRLDNPIHQGYLLQYCELEYNSENILFLVEVDRLSDLMSEELPRVWNDKHWREIDDDVKILEKDRGYDNEDYRRVLEHVSTMLLNAVNESSLKIGKTQAKQASKVVTVTGSEIDHARTSSMIKSLSLPNKNLNNDIRKTSNNWAIMQSVPRRLAGKRSIDLELNRIWSTFLALDAPRQVCVSTSALDRTRTRAKYFTLYGPNIFAEALQECTKTLRTDIMLRFIRSDAFTRMISFLTDSQPLPGPTTLEVPHPYRALFTINDLDILANKTFSCRELVSDSLLYHQFFSYLRLRDCHESLLGVRLLTIFEERVTVKDFDHTEQVAWEIYRYFVAQGSAFEVPIDEMERKEIQRSLANPRISTFDPVKRLLCIALRTFFEEFKKTTEYQGLNKLVIASLKAQKQLGVVIVKQGCLFW